MSLLDVIKYDNICLGSPDEIKVLPDEIIRQLYSSEVINKMSGDPAADMSTLYYCIAANYFYRNEKARQSIRNKFREILLEYEPV